MKASEALKIAQAYHQAREARLALQKKVDELEDTEKAHKQELIDALHALKINAVGDGVRNYALTTKNEPQVEDWSALDSHILQTGELDLLYRRVNPVAIKERWELGMKVPGVAAFPVEKLSVTKAK